VPGILWGEMGTDPSYKPGSSGYKSVFTEPEMGEKGKKIISTFKVSEKYCHRIKLGDPFF
jgi:hypothetical protein